MPFVGACCWGACWRGSVVAVVVAVVGGGVEAEAEAEGVGLEGWLEEGLLVLRRRLESGGVRVYLVVIRVCVVVGVI